MEKNKGITLIALIITIILLLILVGVSLNLLIKGDLFGSAEKAVNGTNAKVEEQQTRVDELMGQMDRASAFAEGTVPTLKYKVYGDDIIVYLEHSLYDYVSKMSIEEKEKKLIKSYLQKQSTSEDNYYSIEDLINEEFNGDRKAFELALAEMSAQIGMCFNYEETLNVILMEFEYYNWLCFDFASNVLHINNNLSVAEKEKKIASIIDVGLSEIRAELQYIAQKNEISYSQLLDGFLNYIEMMELGEEEVYQAYEVTLTLPSGESIPFYYGPSEFMEQQSYVQTQNKSLSMYANYFGINITNVQTSGRYKYAAENYKGTKAEVTVPVELRTANFKVKVSDTETKTYEFIEGQTWWQFVGEENYKVMDDNCAFYGEGGCLVYGYYGTGEEKEQYRISSLNMPKLRVAEIDDTQYYVYIKQGEELEPVIATDTISSSITYELRTTDIATNALDFQSQ